jgi:hypothetical protein
LDGEARRGDRREDDSETGLLVFPKTARIFWGSSDSPGLGQAEAWFARARRCGL